MKMYRILVVLFLVLTLTRCADNEQVQKEEAVKSSGQQQMHDDSISSKIHLQSSVVDTMQVPAPMPEAAPPSLENFQVQPIVGRAAVGTMNTPGEMVLRPVPQGGPWNTESYNALQENGYINCKNDPLSTFSIDVDTASYANIRRFVQGGTLPPPGAVRIEEMVNYFHYDYLRPEGSDTLAIATEVGPSPYNKEYGLVRIGIAAKDIDTASLPPSNLVFLIDVSGSMGAANKLPLLMQSMKLLLEQLGSKDRVAIVTYAGADRVVLPSTSVSNREEILHAIDSLRSGGGTHASQGIVTAYDIAQKNFIEGGNNRVILASDGDFNIGVTSRDELQEMIEEKRAAGVYLTVLGFGMGNYHDDTMEVLADKGNGNYAYIDSLLEAKKVLVKEMGATLFTVARDVKIQIEFNPALVGAYRLLGYENRALADEDFHDDRKDAGEIGAGHRVTALYEIIPAGHPDVPRVDGLKYQQTHLAGENHTRELLTVKVRFKPEGQEQSRELSHSVLLQKKKLAQTSDDFRFAAAVAGYGMLLRHSPLNKDLDWQGCLELIRDAKGKDAEGYRAELQRLVEMSELLAAQQKTQHK